MAGRCQPMPADDHGHTIAAGYHPHTPHSSTTAGRWQALSPLPMPDTASPCRTLHRPPPPYRIGHHRRTLAGSSTAWHTATVTTGRHGRRHTLAASPMLPHAGHRRTLPAVASGRIPYRIRCQHGRHCIPSHPLAARGRRMLPESPRIPTESPRIPHESPPIKKNCATT